MDVPKLQSLVKDLTNQLIARGFVTSRVYLPEQNLKTGMLKLAVVPGRLGSIHLKDGSSDLSLRAAPLTSGDILNVRALEQGLEQLSRARSQQATMEIVLGQRTECLMSSSPASAANHGPPHSAGTIAVSLQPGYMR
jgi:hemolysin activation/secretion protein